MNFKEAVRDLTTNTKDQLFNSRKDIYNTFEFDYIYKLKVNYTINRKYQSVYTFTSKDTKITYFIELQTKKVDNQYYINNVNSGIYN